MNLKCRCPSKRINLVCRKLNCTEICKRHTGITDTRQKIRHTPTKMLIQNKLYMENVLKVENGNVRLYNTEGQCLRTYYSKRNAERAYFFNEETESVQVHLSDGELLIINKFGDVLKSIK